MTSRPEPLTHQITEALARRIMDGQWPVGSKMPTEVELSLRYHCGRITIRRALAKFEKAGMISRRRGVGTVVLAKGPGVSFGYSLTKLDDINQLGQSHQRKILSVTAFEADSAFASKFSVPEGSRYLRLNDLRLGMRNTDPPIVFTYVYVPERYQGVVARAQAEPNRLVVHMIEDLTGKTLTEVRQHVYAEPMPQDIAELLDTEPNTPALRIIRHYVDEKGDKLLLTDSWHPGTRYGFNITIARQPTFL